MAFIVNLHDCLGMVHEDKMLLLFGSVLEVAKMYHDATIGNAINIVLVRIIYLEQNEVDEASMFQFFIF